MKTFLILCVVALSHTPLQAQKSVEKWVDKIVDDMIAMDDLRKYSGAEIPADVETNFIMVQSVKDISVEGDVIRMLVNHGKGTYCTELKFKYTTVKGDYFLVFADPETKNVLGKDVRFVNPWIEKNKICN